MIALLLAAQLAIPDCQAWFFSVRVRYLHSSQPFGQVAVLYIQQWESSMVQDPMEAKATRQRILNEGFELPYIGPGPEEDHTEMRIAPGSFLSASLVRYCCVQSSPFPWICREEP